MSARPGVAQASHRTLRTAGNTSWLNMAKCRGHDPELWFSKDSDDIAAATRICRTCPVTSHCTALSAGADDGIWGGKKHGKRSRTAPIDRCPVCYRNVEPDIDLIEIHKDSANIAKCPGSELPFSLTERVSA